jgi:hypothetical protein
MLTFIKDKVSKIKLPKFSLPKKEKQICDECNTDIPVEVVQASPYRDAAPPPKEKAPKKPKKNGKKLLLRVGIIGCLAAIPIAILSFMFPLTFGKFVVIFGTGLIGMVVISVALFILSKIIKASIVILKAPFYIGKFLAKRFDFILEYDKNIHTEYLFRHSFSKELMWLLGASPILLPVSIYILGKIILSSLLSLVF